MSFILKLHGTPHGPTPYDGQYLKDFDFEAYNGRGLGTFTLFVEEARLFDTMADVYEFYHTVPKCAPVREDGQPNKPVTASNWEFIKVD